jgi:integrase
MKLTETGISKLRLSSGKADEIFFDDVLSGFGVRLREGGSRKYIVHYRQAGIQRRDTIGSTATLTLEEARKRARKILVAVDDGRDPRAEKESKRAASGLIFAAVMRDFLEACQTSLKPKTLLGYTGDLERLWKPLHKLALNAVDRAMIAAHLRIIAKESGPVAANRARGTLSSFYAWAIGEGLCETNPVIGTNMQAQNDPRDRILIEVEKEEPHTINWSEMITVWQALPDGDFGAIVKLLALTGCRREEIGGLQWSEIDFDRRLLNISSDRTKNSKDNTVPLSPLALSILKAIPQRDRGCVFGIGQGGYAGWSKSKNLLDAACGVKNWTLHDLRRTVRTGLGALGIPPHIAEAVINHLPAKLIRTYDTNPYLKERRAALDLWASELDVAIRRANGENVTTLRKA